MTTFITSVAIALPLALAAGNARAAISFDCRGNAQHFGIYVGERYVSAAKIRAGFTEVADDFETMRVITSYATNHPIVDAFRITEAASARIKIESPREDELPAAMYVTGGLVRLEVEPPEYVECTLALR